MSRSWQEMAQALLELEAELRMLGMWAERPPQAHLLASAEPFCVDTLAFEQWLQWVLVPRMGEIIDRRGRLPSVAELVPMGEHAFVQLGRRQQPLLMVLARIDQLSRQLT